MGCMALIVEQWLAGVRVVLVEPSHPGNVGAAARAMKTMGLGTLVVVAPRHPDCLQHEQALAFASGATDVLANARCVSSLAQALAGTTLQVATASMPREFAAQPIDPDQAAQLVLEQVREQGGPVALVFGTERVGLSIAQAQQCSHFASIPTAPDCDSLNLAQAVQVFSWSLRRAAMAAQASNFAAAQASVAPEDKALAARCPLPKARAVWAKHEEVEGMIAHWQDALIEIGFLDPLQPKRLMPRLRQLFGRTRLQSEEIDILRGICGSMIKVAREQRRSEGYSAGPKTPDGSHV